MGSVLCFRERKVHPMSDVTRILSQNRIRRSDARQMARVAFRSQPPTNTCSGSNADQLELCSSGSPSDDLMRDTELVWWGLLTSRPTWMKV